MNLNLKKNLLTYASIPTLFLLTSSASFASDFNLPFINVAGLGVAYADWATAASDASTEFSNPAGLTRLTHQQLVVAPLGILGTTKFKGSSVTPPYPFPLAITQTGSASSDISAFLPSIYYARPINERFVFGAGLTAPFALGTSYPKDSIIRYTSTRSKVVALDFSAGFGAKLNEQLSLGLGLDAVRLTFTLNSMFGPPISFPDAESQNHFRGWGVGWHGGLLYQFLPQSSLGLSFNSMVHIRTTGDSIAFLSAPPIERRTTNQKSNSALPAHAQLSLQHAITPQWTVMSTAFYTNWKTFEKITMKRVMLPTGDTLSVTIPFNYHNTFDYSLGTSYQATDKWLLRVGAQWMNTPSNNQDRAVADPIGSAIVIGVGARYLQTAALSYDVGYGHSFFKQEPVNLVTPVTADIGHTNTQTNVFGAQVNWNMA